MDITVAVNPWPLLAIDIRLWLIHHSHPTLHDCMNLYLPDLQASNLTSFANTMVSY